MNDNDWLFRAMPDNLQDAGRTAAVKVLAALTELDEANASADENEKLSLASHMAATMLVNVLQTARQQERFKQARTDRLLHFLAGDVVVRAEVMAGGGKVNA